MRANARVELTKRSGRELESIVRGEHLAGIIGGGAGIEAWVELWVADDAQAQRAADIVRDSLAQAEDTEASPWTCPVCGEAIEAQFAVCWNCGHEPPASIA